VFSLERDVLPALAAEGRLAALPIEGEFYDIGTPEGWERAERRFGS
jgi:NDP-sugar pyrophosphorylase family protein